MSNLQGRYVLFLRKRIKSKHLVFLLCIVIGVFSGLAAVLLKTSVHYIEHFLRNSTSSDHQNWLFLALPVIGIMLTVIFVQNFVKDDISHGVSKVLYSISRNKSVMKIHNTYSSIIACIFTSGFGGSVGMEAPILSTGSAIGSNLSRVFRLNYKTSTLLIGCGAAAAMSAIFKAPIAGIIFALEVLMLDLTATSIIPLLISAVTGTIISILLLGQQIEFYFTLKDPFNFSALPMYGLLGIVTGFVSLYFMRAIARVENFFKKFKNVYLKALFGGLILSLLIFFFPPLFGEGYSTMKAMLTGNAHELLNNTFFFNISINDYYFLFFLLSILIFKVIATASTTGSGGIGGVFAPSLFMGGIAGFGFAKLFNNLGWVRLSESNFALVGMAGLIAGVIHAPLTAIFLIAEITGGYGLFLPLIVTASISYLTINYFEPHSLYTKKLAQKGQLLTHHKDKAVLSQLDLKPLIETNMSTVLLNQTLGDLVYIISKASRNIFPVIDENKRFLGVIYLDDIREIMFDKEKYNSIFVKDLLTDPPSTISVDDEMEKVMQVFRETNSWNLPVLNDEKYIGFVSRSNVFNAYRKKLIEFSEE